MMHTVANRYELLEPLGAGGMGEVFRARDRLTGQIVALKRVLIPHDRLQLDASIDSDSSGEVLALAVEFRTLAALRHPHIISVLDYGFTTNQPGLPPQPFFTMEYLPDAKPITAVANGQPHEIQMRLLSEMLLALAYLHRRGVVHRDLKPDNVLVEAQGVKVLDFGLAGGFLAEDTEQPSDAIFGTLTYMAPEMLQGDSGSIRADLYAVGLIAYELFTGAHPFDRSNVSKLIDDILNKTPDTSRIDPPLAEVLDRLLAKSPEKRPASAEDALRALCAATGYAVPPETDAIRESYLQAAAFVGRDAELQILRAALDDILTTESQAGGYADAPLQVHDSAAGTSPSTEYRIARAFLIGGESGVGKSRLVDELRTRALIKGALVLRGQSMADGGLPYQVWREPVRRLAISTPLSDLEAGVLKELVPDIATLLNKPVPDVPGLTGEAHQQRLTVILADLFKRQPQPMVLMLEDLQWAGEGLAPLKHMLSQPLNRLLIIGTYRDDERPALPTELPEMQVIKLARLDDAAVAQLSASMLGPSGTLPEVIDLLKRETEGNTFFMVEVVRALAEEAGSLFDVGRMTLPRNVFAGGVQQIVRRRLARVPAHWRALLRFAAVAGRQLDLKVLGTQYSVLSEQGSEEAGKRGSKSASQPVSLSASQQESESAADQQGGEAAGGYADPPLQPPGNQQSARGTATDIPPLQPHDTQHAALGTALSTEYRVLGTALNTEYRVLGTFLTDCANAAVLEVVDERWRFTHDKLREALIADMDAAELQTLHRQVAEAVETVYPDDVGYAETLLEHWRAAENREKELHYIDLVTYRQVELTAEYHRAIGLLEHGLKLTDDSSPMYITLLNRLALAHQRHGGFETAKTLALRALALAESRKDTRRCAEICNNLGLILISLSDYVSAKDYLTRAQQLATEIDAPYQLAVALNLLGLIANTHGDSDAAHDYHTRSLALMQAVGDMHGLASTLNNLGLIASDRADYAAALDYHIRSYDLTKTIGDRRGMAIALTNLAVIARDQGDLETALTRLNESLALYTANGDRHGVAIAQSSLGVIALYQEDYAKAREYFNQAVPTMRATGDKYNLSNMLNALGYIEEETGNTAAALAYYTECLTTMREVGSIYGAANAQVNIGHALLRTDPKSAVQHFREALKVAHEISPSLSLEILADFALHALYSGEAVRAAEWSGVIVAHPAISTDISIRLNELRAELDKALSADEIEAAVQRGKSLDFEAIVLELLKD